MYHNGLQKSKFLGQDSRMLTVPVNPGLAD